MDIHLELLKHKDENENHEKYAKNKAKGIQAEIQETIDAQVSALRLAETNAKQYETKLKEHEEKLTALITDYSDIATRVASLAKKVGALEGKVKEAQEEVRTIRREATSSFKLSDQAVMEGSQRAFDQEMEGMDFQ